MDAEYILAINPGATSTKIAVTCNNKFVFLKNIRHDTEKLQEFNKTSDQLEFRMNLVLQEVEENHVPFGQIRLIGPICQALMRLYGCRRRR